MKTTMMMIATAALIAAPADITATPTTDLTTPAVVTAAPRPDSERARELQLEAESLYSQPKQWKRAARLLEESASLREASDAEAYTCLALAARLRDAMGDYAAARVILERAATQALARGAVIDAAHAYIDAAHVALKEKNHAAAQQMVERGLLLSASPLLTDAQREAVTRRVAE